MFMERDTENSQRHPCVQISHMYVSVGRMVLGWKDNPSRSEFLHGNH